MPIFSYLIGLSLLTSQPVEAASDVNPVSAVTPGAGASVDVEGVLVEAPEPKYVAPTLRDRIGRIWAPVLIDGYGPFRLVLDTGASSSVVIATVADRLGIPLPGSTSIRVHGVTGSAVVASITVDRLEVGELVIQGKVLPVVADVFGGAEGVLGTEALADKRIFIDFENDHIEIARSRGQRAPAGSFRIPVKLAHGRLLTFEARIGSVRTRAIIDTGAQRTIGNSALRKVLLRREIESTPRDIIGVTLDVAQGDSLPTPPIKLGGATIKGLHVTFGDMFIFEHWRLTEEPVLLIGMDVLGLLDTLVIDYRKRELHIRPRR